MILGLHHVQITVPREAEAAAKEFYCEVLGFVEVPKPESLAGRGGFWVNVGNLNVHVGVEDSFDRAATKAHMAYETTDLAHWRQRLEERGIEILEGVPIPGFDRFEFRDPFGNRVELISQAGGLRSDSAPAWANWV
jgi:catechol 2,3-dioxygenase-like lactoylglutathione lyase family enzyme